MKGTVEIDDQVEGLEAVAASAEAAGQLDLDRVVIFGWSYGGYVALLALACRPDVYRVNYTTYVLLRCTWVGRLCSTFP